MTKYAISTQGAQALRQLATGLKNYSSAIKEAGNTLASTVSGLDGLGVYEREILQLITEINKVQSDNSDALETVTTKLNKKAEDIEALVTAGLA